MLHIYLRWVVQSAFLSRSVRHFLRGIWSPTWLRKIPGHVAEAIAVAKSLGLHNGWVRWDTDGSRRQVFDPWRGGVCKIQKQGAILNINDEVELRKALGDLSPRILKQDPAHMAYVEEWVNAIPGSCSLEELERIRRVLDNRFYRVEERDVTSYISDKAITFSDEARDLIPELVSRLGRASLPISIVHGDLVCQNIAFRRNGEPILYDWEYSRTCVVTYDVWFFLYHRTSTNSGDLMLSDFLGLFEEVIRWVFPTIQDIRALHLIHLFEREALLIRNSDFVDSFYSLKRLRLHIDDELSSL